MLKVATTTSHDGEKQVAQAMQMATQLDIVYLPRDRQNLISLREKNCLDYLLIVEAQQLILQGETTLFWHPNMAVPRIKALREGQYDPMVSAMGLKTGHIVLDCTLGMAADALVAAYAVGASGRVVGLESSKYLALLSKYGLDNYRGKNKYLQEIRDRITILNCNYLDFMSNLADKCFDIVYFDPMFSYPLKKSSAINALRPFANYDVITMDVILEAKRVAKARVVMKQNQRSLKFGELQPDCITGGRHSSVSFYVWEVN